MLDLVVNNAIIVSAANGWEPYLGSIAVEDGCIAYAGERRFIPADAHEYVDAEGGILLPGLFNGHCHAELSFLRGAGDGMTLLEQKRAFGKVGWFRALCTADERYAARQFTYCEALLSGTTFLNDNMYWSLGERSADAMAETGIRGALSEDVRPDFAKPDELYDPVRLRGLFEGFQRKGLVPVAAGIAEEDYSQERLRRISALLDALGQGRERSVRYTCHFAETDWRLAAVAERFSQTPAEVLSANGLLNERCLLSHAVHLTEGDVALLAKSGAHVVNTPLCEMKIADGAAHIARLLQAGVPVSLGTDGPLWNNSNDIFREMKAMLLLQTLTAGIRSLGVKDVLNMATVNGAAAFGLGDRLGMLRPGMEADMVLLSPNGLHLHPLRLGRYENVTSALVFSATGRDVRHVFIRGRMRVREGKVLGVDTAYLTRVVEAAGDRIAKELAAAACILEQ